MPFVEHDESAAGLARVATVSFLASRAAPSGGFAIALAGGVALARGAQCRGARQGYGASLAAMLETVAIMGPARFGVPLTQAISAPWLGRLEARGAGPLVQILACALVRILHNLATTAFFIWVIVGGLDAYAGTYDVFPFLPDGTGPALALTAGALLGWTAFASTVQVVIYRRGLRPWPRGAAAGAGLPKSDDAGDDPGAARERAPRVVSPRVAMGMCLAAAGAFTVLLSSTAWPVLGAVAGLLALAWVAARADPRPLRTGAALAGILALGSLTFGLVGGLGVEVATRRATRAALLVLVATWLRAAAGSTGLREVAGRILHRLRRIPSLPEAAAALDVLGAGPSLVPAARSLIRSLAAVPKRPVPVVDAVLGWVASESSWQGSSDPKPRAERVEPAPRPAAN